MSAADDAAARSAGHAAGLRLVRHARAPEVARRRAALVAALRGALISQGSVECVVPLLAPHAGQEPHLHPARVDLDGLPGPLWLQTSPELALKRLVWSGLPSVHAFSPAFRGGREELGARHQPEFLMLEWYRPGADLALLIDDVRRLARAAAEAFETCGASAESRTRHAERLTAARAEGEVLSVAQAFERWAGCSLSPLLEGDVARFVAGARAVGPTGCRDDDDAPTAFGRVLLERVEPALARRGPGWVFLTHWPAFAAALARLDPHDARVALRVEAWWGELEIANGYVELAGAEEHRLRWSEEAARRQGPPPARDAGWLADLDERPLPDTVGMALGVDRLALAMGGERALADVLPFTLQPR